MKMNGNGRARSSFLLIQARAGSVETVADHVRRLDDSCSVDLIGAPYDLVISVDGTHSVDEVVEDVRSADGVLRVLICHPGPAE
jgi:nitrate reductase NapAB chaperone NapD